jgi:hypothetical protein
MHALCGSLNFDLQMGEEKVQLQAYDSQDEQVGISYENAMVCEQLSLVS